jgi:hypothetical protein
MNNRKPAEQAHPKQVLRSLELIMPKTTARKLVAKGSTMGKPKGPTPGGVMWLCHRFGRRHFCWR